MRITTKPTPADRWQRLHASVNWPKAFAKPSLLLASIARRRSARGGALSCLTRSASELLDRGMQSRRCAYESSISSNVSADDSAGMPDGGSRHAAACDHGPTWTASEPNQRCYFIRLLKRRERHGVRRCCERQRKGNSDQPDHSSLPCEPFKKEGAKAGHQCSGFGKVPARPGRRIACPPRSRRSEGALTKIEGANSAMAVGTLRR
jgi:hypothetical protein